MPIRISGLNSGLDTESLVSELVSAYRTKTDKYIKAQTKVSWKQEAWSTLSAKTYSFRTSLDSMRMSSYYNLKTTSVSNSTKASITAGNNAVNGTQSLNITSLAKSGYLTGGVISRADGGDAAASTKLSELGYSGSGKVSLNGKEIDLNGDMTVSDAISKFQDAGVNASFDATNQRIFVSSTDSGKDNDFTLSAMNADGADALKALGLYTESAKTTELYEKYAQYADQDLEQLLKQYNAGTNKDSLLESYAKQYNAATDSATKDAIVQELKSYVDYAKEIQEKTKAGEDLGYNADAVRIDGQDATIYLNGAKFVSNTNTFSINGLTISALATTTTEERIQSGLADDDAVTITTSTDTQGIYDKIKDFLSEYNSLINAMTSAYNAESTSDYEPLTDDEKEAMSESEIEKWEEKGKSGILRRDTTLSTLMSTLTLAMSKSYEINGEYYALSSFGIKTLGIMNAEKNEHNAYHIDGDEDDDTVKANTDKLMAAIIEDPEAVAEFFQKVSTEIYDQLGKQMSSTTLRSYGTFYNDKEMASEYSDYTKTISKWEDKIADLEESYYKKFAAMESALATLQSQSSQLAGLLG